MIVLEYVNVNEIIMDQLHKLGEKIKEIRLSQNMSQEKLAKDIGIQRVSLSHIESGKRNVDALELKRIATIFGVSLDDMLRFEEPSEAVEIKRPGKDINKNITFNSDKFRNTLLYILEKCGGKPNIGETVLYKLLYFIDFDSFEQSGKSITGLNYVKLQFGPVPQAKQFMPVIDQMKLDRSLKIISQQYHNKSQKRYVSLVDADISLFSGTELKVINGVISRLSDMNATSIERYVHEDIPWKNSEDNCIIDYGLVYGRVSPYATVDHEMEFVNSAGKDSLATLKPLTKEEHDYYQDL